MNIFNLSTHIVIYTNLHSMSSREICKFVEINAKSNEIQQTYILNWYMRYIISEQGYKNIRTNLFLGIYLELLWCMQAITENNHNENG